MTLSAARGRAARLVQNHLDAAAATVGRAHRDARDAVADRREDGPPPPGAAPGAQCEKRATPRRRPVSRAITSAASSQPPPHAPDVSCQACARRGLWRPVHDSELVVNPPTPCQIYKNPPAPKKTVGQQACKGEISAFLWYRRYYSKPIKFSRSRRFIFARQRDFFFGGVFWCFFCCFSRVSANFLGGLFFAVPQGIPAISPCKHASSQQGGRTAEGTTGDPLVFYVNVRCVFAPLKPRHPGSRKLCLASRGI